MKSTCTDLANFKKSQGLYTYFSHVFDFWKFQFKKEISALFFSGREQGSTSCSQLKVIPRSSSSWYLGTEILIIKVQNIILDLSDKIVRKATEVELCRPWEFRKKITFVVLCFLPFRFSQFCPQTQHIAFKSSMPPCWMQCVVSRAYWNIRP